MLTEEKLPENVRNRASIRGNEYAWSPKDLPDVFQAAREANLAVLGGPLQFRLPDGTCELYWIEIDVKEKQDSEAWKEYVNRCAEECLQQFHQLASQYNFVDEGLKEFPWLKFKQEEGWDLSSYVCFVMYFDNEETHRATYS